MTAQHTGWIEQPGNVFHLHIVDDYSGSAEVVATFVHRPTDVNPVDGVLANSKVENAEHVVSLLNAPVGSFEYGEEEFTYYVTDFEQDQYDDELWFASLNDPTGEEYAVVFHSGDPDSKEGQAKLERLVHVCGYLNASPEDD